MWGALLASHFVYGAIVHFVAPKPRPGMLLLPLAAAALSSAGAALFVHLGLLSDGRLQQGLAELRREGKTREEAQMISLQRMQPLAIIGWVLAETSTLLGLVLAILGEVPFTRFALFLAIGVAAHLACRPRLSRIEALLRATYV